MSGLREWPDEERPFVVGSRIEASYSCTPGKPGLGTLTSDEVYFVAGMRSGMRSWMRPPGDGGGFVGGSLVRGTGYQMTASHYQISHGGQRVVLRRGTEHG